MTHRSFALIASRTTVFGVVKNDTYLVKYLIIFTFLRRFELFKSTLAS